MRLLDLALKIFKDDNNKVIEVGGRVNKLVINLFKTNKLRN